jgi:hypothetical protein
MAKGKWQMTRGKLQRAKSKWKMEKGKVDTAKKTVDGPLKM